MEQPKKSSWWKPEFVLVLIMLTVLTVIVAFVLYPTANPADANYKETLTYKKDILTAILTVFGAWVGAGAAYFFGRENLKQSSESLLAMQRQMTGQDKLSALVVKDMESHMIDLIYTPDTTVEQVMQGLHSNNHNWFFLVVNPDKTYELVTDDEFNDFVASSYQSNTTYDELKAKKVSDVLKTLKDRNKRKTSHVEVNISDTVFVANEKLQKKDIYIALIADPTGVPKYYFTTADIRKVLLK